MMQTLAISLTNTAWTAVTADHATVAIDIKTAGQVLIHLGDATTPGVDAPGIAYASWQNGPDVVIEGLVETDRVWCRSVGPSAEIVAVRK